VEIMMKADSERKANHIAVCVCTYKRPEMLQRLLDDLSVQETGGAFEFSIVVMDNDPSRSAEPVVSAFSTRSTVPVTYGAEPRQGICLVRNRAIEHAAGDFIAFIDDDEFPDRRWLLELFRTCNVDGVDGVLGPVLRHFDETPPQWVIKGNFERRPRHATGFVIDWREGRTGNVLLKRSAFEPGEPPFDTNFHRGGDVDFFRRMTAKGRVFIWCDEAVVYEVVPPARWTRSFMLKRALLRGSIASRRGPLRLSSIGKSMLAVPAYAVGLPFALVLGQHRFMGLLIRLCNHLGKLLALIGIKPVKSLYVTD
jgi:glycosyltransferase involved in cell wall biosynthesis